MRRCEADREQKHQKQAATYDAYRVVNQLRMASAGELLLISGSQCSKARFLAHETTLTLPVWHTIITVSAHYVTHFHEIMN